MPKLKRLAVDIPEDLHAALSEDAKQRNVPMAFLVRTLLSRHLGGDDHETMKAATVRMLREGASNETIAAELAMRFGKANRSSINWYRSKLRRDGEDIVSDAEAKEGERLAAFEASLD